MVFEGWGGALNGDISSVKTKVGIEWTDAARDDGSLARMLS